ncbi:hypothetical protein OIU78_020623 [Salix suchowensis]|nr:hypothetical protein OIU78_020623 [Salix suchowensis]
MFLRLYCEPMSTLTVNNCCIMGRGVVVVSCNPSSAREQMLSVAVILVCFSISSNPCSCQVCFLDIIIYLVLCLCANKLN